MAYGVSIAISSVSPQTNVNKISINCSLLTFSTDFTEDGGSTFYQVRDDNRYWSFKVGSNGDVQAKPSSFKSGITEINCPRDNNATKTIYATYHYGVDIGYYIWSRETYVNDATYTKYKEDSFTQDDGVNYRYNYYFKEKTESGLYIYEKYEQQRTKYWSSRNVRQSEEVTLTVYSAPPEFVFVGCDGSGKWHMGSSISELITNINDFAAAARQWKQWKNQVPPAACPGFSLNGYLSAGQINKVYEYVELSSPNCKKDDRPTATMFNALADKINGKS